MAFPCFKTSMNGTLGPMENVGAERGMDAGLEAMDGGPDLVMEEIEQVKVGLHDMQDELAKIKLELVELKNEGRNQKYARVVLFVLLAAIIFIVMK